jgi:ParB family chromosome partitioning protein
MVAEVAGPAVAEANLTLRAKAQKQIIRDCLAGANGRVKVENWACGWMAFPFHRYTNGRCALSAYLEGLLP